MIEEKEDIIYLDNNIKVISIKSFGVATKDNFWYDQDQDELVIITQGNAKLQIEDKVISLSKGDKYYIYKHIKHRVNFTSYDCEWLCIFFQNNLING